MASNAAIFFAGVGTTFLILGAGFGGGMFMATSALQDSKNSYQARASEDLPAPIRVVLPASAQAAEPAEAQKQPAAPEQPTAPPQVQPLAKQAQIAPETVEKAETRKADSDKRKRRQAERRTKRLAANRNHRHETAPLSEAPVMAFGRDEQQPFNEGFKLFGN
jgi:type IV secretory pathway VirB10-like protein